jgi:aspartyl-tRNA(Asn)/glutamyl-tRNA(Gln) amidotransferase subunit A
MPDAYSLCEAAEAVRVGRIRPTDLVDACLERIAEHDGVVRAWVLVDEETVRREAEAMTVEAELGSFRGPLHGVPVGIKDIIDVAGLSTEAGSPLRKGCIAKEDAPVVAGLRRAGAIILGKTVTVEFACFDPSPTRNPWDSKLEHTPGGSSSGSAAAVAMEMCFGALGTQTGGSLVRPASYCGVSTCKPTFGRVDRAGVVPVSYHFDHVGPMARRVPDLGLMLDCLPASHDFCPPRREPGGPAMYDTAPRLGIVAPFFMAEAAPNVRSVVEKALRKLGEETTVELVTPAVDFEAIQEVHTTVMAVEAAAYHREDFAAHRGSYGPMIASLLDQGLDTSGVEFANALGFLHEFRRRAPAMLEGFDALIMPATDTTAPTLETTGPKRFQCPWSCSGMPVVSLPCGLVENGLPVSVQLVGHHHEDERLLEIAEWCEERFEFDGRPELLAPGV